MNKKNLFSKILFFAVFQGLRYTDATNYNNNNKKTVIE